MFSTTWYSIPNSGPRSLLENGVAPLPKWARLSGTNAPSNGGVGSKKSPSLRAVMDRYNNLLLATDEAMGDIEKALDKPVDMSKMILELLETAMALKQEYAAFRANF